MTTTDTLRIQLAATDVRRDPYGVAGAALNLLAANPQDGFAAEQYVQALSVLKLTAAGQRFLGTPGAIGGPGGAARGGARGGVIPWTSRARRFAANLRALEDRNAAGARFVQEAARQLTHFELHQTADGNFEVLATESPVGPAPAHPASHWLGGLANHRAATNLWQFDRKQTPVPHPVAFDGLGYGWLFTHVFDTTLNSYLNYSCALYVLEIDPLSLAMLLHMQDLQAYIAHPRVRWFIGPDTETVMGEFRRALEDTPAWTIPERFVRCALRPPPARPALDMEASINQLREHRERQRAVRVAQTEPYYHDKDTRYWSRRFAEASSGRQEPLRVLGITSRYTTVLQHSMRELQSAARDAMEGGQDGVARCAFEVVLEPDDHSLENPFIERIAAFRPDLIVQISRMRYENPHLPRNVPFLSWDQDNLPCMRTPQATASLDDDGVTYVAGHGAIFGYGHLNWPEERCIFCHPAGATYRYSAEPVSEELRAKHDCDVSYVSNAAGSPESLAAQLRERWQRDAGWSEVFDGAAREILEGSLAGRGWDDVAIGALIRVATARAGLVREAAPLHELGMDMHRYADRCYRHATLSWVSRWCTAHGKKLRLYGRGWEDHPEFKQWASGTAEPGEEMRAIYQASRINLQLIESGFIHSRSLDGLAAGGFFLTRHSSADGDDPEALRDIHLLGQWAVEQGITSHEQIVGNADPTIRVRWQRTLAHHPWPPEHALRVLKVWARTPLAVVAFPMLPQVSFHDERSFGELAAKFLADDALRQSMGDAMRRIVLEQFSYRSRWNQFLAHVTSGLAAAGKSEG